MSHTVLQPELNDTEGALGRWMVTIFNNDHNSQDEVIHTLILATQCARQEAEIEVWEAEAYGRAPVHFDARERCEEIASIISKIGVRTEVSREWE